MSGRSSAGDGRVWEDPWDLLRHLGIQEPSEIDVEAIAEHCGVTIVYGDLHGAGARIVSHGGRAVIQVDREAHPYRQRFSAAHELAHWMFDRGGLAHVFTGDPARPEYQDRGWFVEGPEQRANRWAADLLMPKPFFVPDAADRDVTFATVWRLARRYRTSVTATALRLVDHGSHPAMVVCSRPENRWRFFHHGPGITSAFWPRDQPEPGTVAHRLLWGWGKSPGPTDVPSDGWFERKDAWWFTVREDSREVGNGDVLSLLSWPDGGQVTASRMPHTWLPWAPGQNARRRLVKTLREKWGYRRVRGAKGEAVLVTEEPAPHRLVIPGHKSLDRARCREIVAAVAEHKGVARDRVLLSMLVEPKYVVEERARRRQREAVENQLPPWLGG